MMEQQTKTNLLNVETWIRLLYMVVFGFLSILARMVVGIVAVLQFLLVLITGKDNSNLRDLGQGTSKWTYQAFLFLTFNSDEKPFPFSDWPEIDSKMGANGEFTAKNLAEDTSDSNKTSVVIESESSVDDVPTFVEGEDEEPKSQGDKPA
ncbi:MAG: DUF4389 domain-containing protein [Porticoccus sp.]|nr:DUF4389 domain-containing protein [Porticoccus sp.]